MSYINKLINILNEEKNTKQFKIVKMDFDSIETEQGKIMFIGSIDKCNKWANKKGLRLKKDSKQLFGGYFIDDDGMAYMPLIANNEDKVGQTSDI